MYFNHKTKQNVSNAFWYASTQFNIDINFDMTNNLALSHFFTTNQIRKLMKISKCVTHFAKLVMIIKSQIII